MTTESKNCAACAIGDEESFFKPFLQRRIMKYILMTLPLAAVVVASLMTAQER